MSTDFFSKSTFLKNSFYTIKLSNSLDPDQTGHYVRPDLAPNCLQRLSALVGKELLTSKTGLKPPIKNRQNRCLQDQLSLNEGPKYCRMLLLTCIKR